MVSAAGARAGRLTCKPADVPFTAKARDQLRADNDKTVARLYGISDAEFTHLLRSFKGMATKRPEYLALLGSP